MKNSTMPSLRVSQGFRQQVEDVLEPDETLSSFMKMSVERALEERQMQNAFIARGLQAEREAAETGHYVTKHDVMGRLNAILKAERSR